MRGEFEADDGQDDAGRGVHGKAQGPFGDVQGFADGPAGEVPSGGEHRENQDEQATAHEFAGGSA